MITIDLTDVKSGIEKQKKKSPLKYGITTGFVGVAAGTFGVLAIKSGVERLSSAESTYGGIGPLITGGLGVGLSILSIFSIAETMDVINKNVKFSKLKKNNQSTSKSDENLKSANPD